MSVCLSVCVSPSVPTVPHSVRLVCLLSAVASLVSPATRKHSKKTQLGFDSALASALFTQYFWHTKHNSTHCARGSRDAFLLHSLLFYLVREQQKAKQNHMKLTAITTHTFDLRSLKCLLSQTHSLPHALTHSRDALLSFTCSMHF